MGRYGLKESEPFALGTPIVIVGGGLSGLALSRELRSRNQDHIVLEASLATKNPSIHYLTSPSTAASLGLTDQYNDAATRRKPITGYARYDALSPGLEILEGVKSSETRANGFVTFSLSELSEWLGKESKGYVYNGRSVCHLERSGRNWITQTTQGDVITSQIVIDATGSRSRVLSGLIPPEIMSDTVNQRLARACYGGIYPYGGPEDTLLFADRFTIAGKDSPSEGAGWVMPLGNGMAEVVVAWETPLGNISNWRSPKLINLLEAYINWFNARGIPIGFDKRQEVVSGSFSQGLLDYRRIPSDVGLAAFGESLGLNQPLNGYLIGNIAGYARVMGDEAQKYLDTGKWDPHNSLVGTSPINFGQQVALGKRKMEGVMSGKGRSAATARLEEFLVKSLGADGLWDAIDGGIPPSKVIAGLIRHPQYVNGVTRIGVDYLKLLLNEDLYRNELKEKFVRHFSGWSKKTKISAESVDYNVNSEYRALQQ